MKIPNIALSILIGLIAYSPSSAQERHVAFLRASYFVNDSFQSYGGNVLLNVQPGYFLCHTSYGYSSKGSSYSYDFFADTLVSALILVDQVHIVCTGWYYPANDDGEQEPYYGEADVDAFRDSHGFHVQSGSIDMLFADSRSPAFSHDLMFYTR